MRDINEGIGDDVSSNNMPCFRRSFSHFSLSRLFCLGVRSVGSVVAAAPVPDSPSCVAESSLTAAVSIFFLDLDLLRFFFGGGCALELDCSAGGSWAGISAVCEVELGDASASTSAPNPASTCVRLYRKLVIRVMENRSPRESREFALAPISSYLVCHESLIEPIFPYHSQ